MELLDQDNFAIQNEDKKNDEEEEEFIEDNVGKEGSERIEIKESEEVKIQISEEEKEEKKNLVGIIERLKEDLDSKEYESLGQIYEQYLNNEDITKRNIKPGTNIKLLFTMFYFTIPLFCIINLMGVFQSISIMNVIFQIFKNSLYNYYKYLMNKSSEIEKMSLKDYMNQYEYYEMFYKDVKKETFDFNLMMFMAFLGDALLISRGFRISISVFSAINIGAIFLILNFKFGDYNRDNNTYTIFGMLYLLLTWLLLFIGVGASALLSQQIMIDSNYKYDDYITKLDEESKQKLKKKREERAKKMQEKGKFKVKKNSYTSSELENLGDIGIDEESSKQNDGNNNENGVRSVKSENSLDNKTDNNEQKYQKEKSQEINIKGLAQDFAEIKNESKTLKRSQTIEEGDKFGNQKSKKIRKRTNSKTKSVKKNKFSSFFTICITTILGYFLKYFLNMIIVGENSLFEKNYIHVIVDLIKHENKDIKCETELEFDCYENLINNKNYSFINSTLFEKLAHHISEYDQKKPAFFIMAGYYGVSIIFSIILYSIFVCIFTKNKKGNNVNGDKYRVCEICGYTIYSEDIILNKPPCCECCKLIWCGTCHNYLNMIVGSVSFCYDEEEKNEIDICICCQCCDQEEINYNKNKEFFCYCYQAKRKQNWFNKFITSETQKKYFHIC